MVKKIFIVSFVIFLISCTNSNNEEANSANQNIWNLSDGVEFPANRPLSRAEDGVFLNDGTLIVADQRYGLAKIEVDGTVEPFGKFNELGYSHNPPAVESGPNGVHLTPDKEFIITADVFSGYIYKTSVKSGDTEIIYKHEFGVNTAIEDSTGAVWFTQSTKNKNEERLFGALSKPLGDGAVYRLSLIHISEPTRPY